jgi:hypothetical protein
MATELLIFAIGLPAVIYILNCAVAREIKTVKLKPALLYVTTVAMMGVLGEVFVGSIYQTLFDKHLWDYTVLPIHEGFTSRYAPVIWGSYGWYLYLSHGTLRRYGITSTKHLALIFALETVFLEALTNGSFKLFFGEYLFYYSPADLWHLTSVQAMPFYLVAGYAIATAVDRFARATRFNIVINSYVTYVFFCLVRKARTADNSIMPA